jgi:hypothetical protein
MEEVREFSWALFETHVGKTFDLVGPDGRRVPIVFQNLADRGRSSFGTMFSLYFLVPPEGPSEQGLFRLEQEDLGSLELTLVPVRSEGDSLVFEAAMNLLGSEGE